MPRPKDSASAQLYKIDRYRSHGRLGPLFCGTIDLELYASNGTRSSGSRRR